jgi:hypothetical protein
MKYAVRQWYLSQLANLKGYIMNPDNHLLTGLMAEFEPDQRSLLERATKGMCLATRSFCFISVASILVNSLFLSAYLFISFIKSIYLF